MTPTSLVARYRPLETALVLYLPIGQPFDCRTDDRKNNDKSQHCKRCNEGTSPYFKQNRFHGNTRS